MNGWTKTFFGVLICIAVFVWAQVVHSPSDGNAHIFFLNVGQGDAELIEKGDYQILIDGGPDDSVLAELGKTMPATDRKIEILILTHPHSDHLAGINQVIDRYEIGAIYFSGATYTTNGYLEFLQKVKDKNISIIVPKIGESITPYDNAKLTFLWPGEKYKEQVSENLNNTSVVGRYCYFSICALFTGDIENDEQALMFSEIEKEGLGIDLQILKVPHHGSTNGTDEILLEKIKPDHAVIEVGADNKFGHPHAATLDLLKNAGIKVYRTDRDGTIEFILSESGITVKN